jgi:2-polyprenyl-3-methyl-5-hydroxy-6-metoxy-1,4-benzoquinol methylase
MQTLTKVDNCIACGHDQLELVLDLYEQPLANNYVTQIVPANEYYPLAVNLCTKCYHLQLTHIVDPEIIYRDYAYVSGTSQTYLEYMTWFAKWTREYSNRFHGHVLDIGCNDGSQLDAFANLGFITYGVDPAENLHSTSTEKGHRVVCGFWNKDSVNQLTHSCFDIITCQNAFAHNTDPVEFLKLLEPIVNDSGMVFIQTSQADMVRNGEFDTIYHEHLSFYNINSFNQMVERTGFHLIDAIKTPIHGNSYVFVLSKSKNRKHHIKNLIAMESDLLNKDTYTKWAARAQSITKEFKKSIEFFRREGYMIVGYGAAAKGMTLLNFAKVDLDFIVDDNPLKQGKISPGRNIPIVGIDYLEQHRENKILFVPLAWNFFKEIKSKILVHRGNDTVNCFLKYFPEVESGI